MGKCKIKRDYAAFYENINSRAVLVTVQVPHIVILRKLTEKTIPLFCPFVGAHTTLKYLNSSYYDLMIVILKKV